MGTSLGACELNHGYESVFLFIKFMREVKVTTIFYWRIKHGLFPSVCIGDHHESILECYTILMTICSEHILTDIWTILQSVLL